MNAVVWSKIQTYFSALKKVVKHCNISGCLLKPQDLVSPSHNTEQKVRITVRSVLCSHPHLWLHMSTWAVGIPWGLQTPPLNAVQTLSLLYVCLIAEPMSMHFSLWQLQLASEDISIGLWFMLKASQSSPPLVVSNDTLKYLSPRGCFQHQAILITSSVLIYLNVRKCESYCSKCQKWFCIEIIDIQEPWII